MLLLPVAKPPWKKLGRRLESMLRKALYEYRMLEGVTRVGVALSGGKDSLTLLFLLHAISGRGFPNLEIHAFHVGGEFSCGAGIELSFLKGICRTLDIPFHTRTQKRQEDECYACSRQRRRLLFDMAKEVSIETIAFGHHRDDNAQTLLMNLLHKGEFAGMLPNLRMVDYGVAIIRPLIYISEAEIRTFSKEHGFARITCQCPIGAQSMRKKVDRLLTDLEDLYPNVRENLSRASLVYGSEKARMELNERELLEDNEAHEKAFAYPFNQ